LSARLELELGIERVERAEADLVVAGFFADERPLRGAVGRADWRLCGLVSEQLAAERLRGEPGDALLVATSGKLAAPYVLVLGLGERAHFGGDDMRGHTRDAVARSVRLGAASIVLAPLGVGDNPLWELVDDIVSAAVDALNAAAADAVLRLRLAVAPEEAARVGSALADVSAGIPGVKFERLRESQPASGTPSGGLVPGYADRAEP
jgi:hypothetical protein